jgi:hypothetical protein
MEIRGAGAIAVQHGAGWLAFVIGALALLPPAEGKGADDGVRYRFSPRFPFRAPKAWNGKTAGTAENNPLVVGGRPMWRFDHVRPFDPTLASSYKPAVWKKRQGSPKWTVELEEHMHGGQPAATVDGKEVRIGIRTAWTGQPGQKVIALTFIAPKKGGYAVAGTVTPRVFDAGAPLGLLVMKIDRASGQVSEVARVELKNDQETRLLGVYASLEKEEELSLVPFFPGRGLVAATYVIKDLAVVLGRLKVLPGRPSARKAPAEEGGPKGKGAEKGSAEKRSPAAAEEKPPPRNLVKNGGFEIVDKRTEFAGGWHEHNWGAAGVRSSVRLDRVNAHRGEHSVVVRSLGDGAKPGVFTTVLLEPGKYELSYWAAADVAEKETVPVRSYLAGSDLDADAAGADWKRFAHEVGIEKRQMNASVRLWTEAARVRVWVDDVELRRVE